MDLLAGFALLLPVTQAFSRITLVKLPKSTHNDLFLDFDENINKLTKKHVDEVRENFVSKNGFPSAPRDSTRMTSSGSSPALYSWTLPPRRVAVSQNVLTRCPSASGVLADPGRATQAEYFLITGHISSENFF